MNILEELRGILAILKYEKDILHKTILTDNERTYYQGKIDMLTEIIDMFDNDES